ncbi:MAG: hypothetical protein P9E88_05740 [Candidatus Competibacter sp.]|jgi:hypothetical protein|nr:hypothetical protein [Candidatus Competibacter sp.]
MRMLFNFTFNNPRGEKITDWVWLNRDRDEQWISYSPWIGTAPSGDTEQVNHFWAPIALYMKEGDSVIALVRGIAVDDLTKNIGDTGTGRLYAGVVSYPSPIEFTWECIAVGEKAVKTQPPPSSSASRPSPDDAIRIRPFTRP